MNKDDFINGIRTVVKNGVYGLAAFSLIGVSVRSFTVDADIQRKLPDDSQTELLSQAPRWVVERTGASAPSVLSSGTIVLSGTTYTIG
jgi:hypothetical protein